MTLKDENKNNIVFEIYLPVSSFLFAILEYILVERIIIILNIIYFLINQYILTALVYYDLELCKLSKELK